jgi:hypothetical protein
MDEGHGWLFGCLLFEKNGYGFIEKYYRPLPTFQLERRRV